MPFIRTPVKQVPVERAVEKAMTENMMNLSGRDAVMFVDNNYKCRCVGGLMLSSVTAMRRRVGQCPSACVLTESV